MGAGLFRPRGQPSLLGFLGGHGPGTFTRCRPGNGVVRRREERQGPPRTEVVEVGVALSCFLTVMLGTVTLEVSTSNLLVRNCWTRRDRPRTYWSTALCMFSQRSPNGPYNWTSAYRSRNR